MSKGVHILIIYTGGTIGMIKDYKTNARKEAELLLKEADLKSDSIMKEAQEKVIKIHDDIVATGAAYSKSTVGGYKE